MNKVLKWWEEIVEESKSYGEKLEDLEWYLQPRLPGSAWPGGYTVVYYLPDDDIICADCATEEVKKYLADTENYDEQDLPCDYSTYDEGPVMYCEQCGHMFVASYGDPDLSDEENDKMFDLQCECEHCKARREQK
jgi:rubredoxin